MHLAQMQIETHCEMSKFHKFVCVPTHSSHSINFILSTILDCHRWRRMRGFFLSHDFSVSFFIFFCDYIALDLHVYGLLPYKYLEFIQQRIRYLYILFLLKAINCKRTKNNFLFSENNSSKQKYIGEKTNVVRKSWLGLLLRSFQIVLFRWKTFKNSCNDTSFNSTCLLQLEKGACQTVTKKWLIDWWGCESSCDGHLIAFFSVAKNFFLQKKLQLYFSKTRENSHRMWGKKLLILFPDNLTIIKVKQNSRFVWLIKSFINRSYMISVRLFLFVINLQTNNV